MLKIFLLSVLCHIIDDFVLQPVCLSKLKQKSFWEKEAPEDMYRNDYKVALLIHSVSWSIMIMLPYFWYWPNTLSLAMAFVFVWNVWGHYITDNEKANKKKMNLLNDQLIHLFQLVMTFILFWIVN